MKSVDEWGQVYLDELARILELGDPDIHPGNMALVKVIDGVRREASEDMRTICRGVLAEFAVPQENYLKLDQIMRSIPLPGDEGYVDVYAEWVSSEGRLKSGAMNLIDLRDKAEFVDE